MARTRLKGGPRDGDEIVCPCIGACQCTTFGHGMSNIETIDDGYIENLMYRRDGDCWVPDHIERVTMVVRNVCPRCNRPMPAGTVNCKNCGAEMYPSGEWEEDGND